MLSLTKKLSDEGEHIYALNVWTADDKRNQTLGGQSDEAADEVLSP